MLNDRDESGQATPTFDIEVAVTHVDGNAQRLRSPWRLGVFASVPAALSRREQVMESRESRIAYKGGRGRRQAVQALV